MGSQVDQPTGTGREDDPAAGPAVVDAVGVSKTFGATKALRGVSVSIAPRESRALVGRNGAGKSTLVGVLTGLLAPDEGEVWFSGEAAPEPRERERWLEHVSCVYQRPSVIPALTVAENIFINRHPRRAFGLVDWKRLRSDAAEALDEWGIDVDPAATASDLTIEARQLVEIARALAVGSRFIILDEPTAQLEGREIERLFERIKLLQAAGVAFLYISHHLEEIYEVCDQVTVLRDGEKVTEAAVSEMTRKDVVEAMIGGRAPIARNGRADTRPVAERPAVLRTRSLSLAPWYDDVDLAVRAGEMVGLAGLVGSGKAHVADTVIGLLEADAGEIEVGGEVLDPGNVASAIEMGIGYVPGDRHARGLVPMMGVDENVTLTLLPRLSQRLGVIDSSARGRDAQGLIQSLEIVAASPHQRVRSLSGGNQQKVVMGRALASNPRVLVLVNPTAGVDVASKQALQDIVEQTRARGAGVLLASDELDDLAACDRVIVMLEGRVVKELAAGWTESELVSTMEGVHPDGIQ
jgi:simple sugar transport system ATP-binding protein